VHCAVEFLLLFWNVKTITLSSVVQWSTGYFSCTVLVKQAGLLILFIYILMFGIAAFLDFIHHPLETRKHNILETGSVFLLRWGGREMPTQHFNYKYIVLWTFLKTHFMSFIIPLISELFICDVVLGDCVFRLNPMRAENGWDILSAKQSGYL
jgi:hypothetical protein